MADAKVVSADSKVVSADSKMVSASAERYCHVIVTDLRDAAVTGFTVTPPFDRNENVIDGRPKILANWSNNPTLSSYIG